MVIRDTFCYPFRSLLVLLTLTAICYRYIQFILITTGVYASRIWTMAIAATLLYLSSRSVNFVKSMQQWFFPVGWGYDKKQYSTIQLTRWDNKKLCIYRVPLLIAIILCCTIAPKESDLDFANPNFQLGRSEAATSTFVLIFCFIGKFAMCTRNARLICYRSFLIFYLFCSDTGLFGLATEIPASTYVLIL